MDVYATVAGYGFLLILALFFLFFIVLSSAEVKENIIVHSEKTDLKRSRTVAITGEISSPLNVVYYSILSLILLQLIIFILLI